MNKKGIISIIILLVVIASAIVFFNRNKGIDEDAVQVGNVTAPETGGKMVVDNTIKEASTSTESVEYENGIYWGFVKGSEIVNGTAVLSIDFLQSFATEKEQLVASIEDDFCTISTQVPYKTKAEFLTAAKALKESEVDAFISTTSCFPNGMNYFRNASSQLRDKALADNFIAYYDNGDGIINTGNAQTLHNILKNRADTSSNWQITIQNNKITTLNESFRP